MPLRQFQCPVCGQTGETLKKSTPKCNHNQDEENNPVEMVEVIVAPNQKFMVAANAATGTSKIKDSEKVLKARARNHSRDVLADETIQKNLDMGSKESVARNLLNEKGERRRKIDDI